MQQYLFHNDGNGSSTERGLAARECPKMARGCVVFQDYDNDGRPDAIVTGLPQEI